MAHECPRKWALHYLWKEPQIPTQALQDGIELHSEMARLLLGKAGRHEPESRIGKMCRALLPYADGLTGAQVEAVACVRLPEHGTSIDLRADLICGSHLIDWKSTGAASPNATLPTPGGGRKPWVPQSLQDDFQANIYSYLMMRRDPSLTAVNASWAYVSKKFDLGQEPRTWAVRHVFERGACSQWFERVVLPVVALMRSMRELWAEGQLPAPVLIPHNPPSCEQRGLFCDVSGRCRFLSSPITDYAGLHLPVI